MKFSLSSINSQNIKKGLNYIRYNGLGGVWSRVKYKMSGPGLAYNSWYKEKHEADPEELDRQRQVKFNYEPTFSILVPVYMTPEFFLRAMIESVCNQTYGKWQLCIVDGSQGNKTEDVYIEDEPNTDSETYKKIYRLETEKIVHEYMDKDSRIDYVILEENLGISENTNKALEMACGDYIVLLDHDDVLTDDALFHMASALQEERYDALYSDEDKMSEDGIKYSDPALKPDFSLDLLRAHNYITHLFVAKRELAIKVGGFRKEYDGAQDYDFILRCCENIYSEDVDKRVRVKHIPRVLYHWRINNRSVAANPHKKEYAKEAGKKALGDHLKRMKEYATVSHTDMWGIYKVNYDTPGNPLVSIVIPGGDDPVFMKKCINPLYDKARYSNFEIIIVCGELSNSVMPKFYSDLEHQRKNIRVVNDVSLSTMSAVRNYGAAQAKGDYILFLDNNTEIIDYTSLGEMLGICMRQEVGAVSGTLYTDAGNTYHKGMAVGLNGIAEYLYQGIKKDGFGYLMHNRVNENFSAVSASCLLVKRDLFEKIGGFSDKFKTDIADVDFCLRVRQYNKLIVGAADAGWYYHNTQSSTKIDTITKESTERIIRQDENLFKVLWKQFLDQGDPYYNPNFTKEGNPFALS